MKMRVAMLAAVPDLEAPGTFACRDALRDAFVNKPFERAIKGNAVVGNARAFQRSANLVMRKWMRSRLERFDDSHTSARDATTPRRDQLAGVGSCEGVRGKCGRSVSGHDRMETVRFLMQHCSI